MKRNACVSYGMLFAAFCMVSTGYSQTENTGWANNAMTSMKKQVGTYIRASRLPGMAIAVVAGGKFNFLNLGVADRETHTPVKTDTVFRIGGISKLFVVMSILKLVEEGKIDLHLPVNRYLTGLQVPDYGGHAVTMADLLQDTTGLDESGLGLSSLRNDSKGLQNYLRSHMPVAVMPAGKYIKYSNFSFGLAARVVEVLSGQSYCDYVNTHWLRPLELSSTAFSRWALQGKPLAKGYLLTRAGYRQMPFDWIKNYPALAMQTNAHDMALFIKALLDEGDHGVSPAIIDAMSRQQFSHHRNIAGVTFGLKEQFYGDTRVLWSWGWVAGFKSIIMLVPQLHIGVFIASNYEISGNRQQNLRDILHVKSLVLKSLLPRPRKDTHVTVGTIDRTYAGHYRNMRYSHFTFQKIGNLFNEKFVKVVDDKLTIGSAEYVHVGKDLFQSINSNQRIWFERDQNGRVITMAMSDKAFTRLVWYQSRSIHILLLFSALTTMVIFIGVYPLIRKRIGESTLHNMLVWMVLNSFVSLASFVVLVAILSNLAGIEFWYQTTAVATIKLVPVLAFLWALAGFINVMIAWRNTSCSRTIKLYVLAGGIAQLVYFSFLLNYRLISFDYSMF